MGPTAAVVTEELITDEQLLAIDALLSKLAGQIIRTRKGRVWSLWIDERPLDVSATDPHTVTLAAGLNSSQDYDMLRELGQRLADLLGGSMTEPTK
ncbi:hypothetical protein [Prosthecobacter sp.]|uniref:hypothetical protein n=1 Tax=Prosthecobacter sp. TaxID=1965333 RepID=UPI003783847C